MAKSDVDAILKDFEVRKPLFAEFCPKTKTLIEDLLSDASIPVQSIQFRIKSTDKLSRKFSDPTKNYEVLDDITDLVGLRVITYLSTDVQKAVDLIRSQFNVDDERSSDKRLKEPHEFGYSAINIVCKHTPGRLTDVQYKKFAAVVCEIQVTTVLMHAWAEIEHSWYDLKEFYPNHIRRRFNQLSAILELADTQFLEISQSGSNYERSVAVRVQTGPQHVPLDLVSLDAFIRTEPVVAAVDKSIATALGGRISERSTPYWLVRVMSILRSFDLTSFEHLAALLGKYKFAIPEYVSRCKEEVWQANRNGKLYSGISIFHLVGLLALAKGGADSSEVLSIYDPSRRKPTRHQIAVAKQVADEAHKSR